MSAQARWKTIQAILGTTQDGIPGKNDAEALDSLEDAALAEHRAGKATTPVPAPGGADDGRVDDRSEKNIATLLPEVRPYARALIRAAKAEGIDAKVISGTRTYEEQDLIFAQGRTRPGKIVTKARGGYSNHNFGVAFDIGIFNGSDYLEDSPLYDKVAKLGKAIGLSPGAYWTNFKDKPHFEYNPRGYTLAQMRDRKANGQSLV